LEAVELQDSAYPYHDWNERVAAECYAPNATARLLDGDGRIERIVNNYAKISFNFGPTLFSWMKENAPEVVAAVVEADHQSRGRFSGHGNAIAQCYNHMIMPLANARDQHTQVLWGIRDFEHRFGRKPEGMWLPETAADDGSLDALAEHGIQFTILSPFQASRVRRLGAEEWRDVNGGHIDPSMPYRVNLPSGRAIAVFFYDAPVAKSIAFEHLLSDGGNFARRLMDGFSEDREWDQLMHIATDGESYGHHHRYGEMALAYALNSIDTDKSARLTNYAEFLEQHPPTWEAQIHQKTAWSCVHGVERWNSNCGCNSGGYPNWNQNWRRPLRQALDWLRDELAPKFDAKAKELLRDPWAARDDYISVILDRSSKNITEFVGRHGARAFTEADQVSALRLLEMQRHAMLMYTSCGWFFDDISGIESVQVIQYAARALQLAKDLLDEDLESGFLERLGQAKSNLRERRDGRLIYEDFVRPARMDREKVGAHFAVSSVFETYEQTARIYSFTVEQADRQFLTVGNARLAIGKAKVTFEVTRNSDILTYCVLHLGDHNVNCGVESYSGPDAYATLSREIREAFDRADFPQIIRLMDRHFGESHYSLQSLFRDEQRKVLNQILTSTRDDIHSTYRLIVDRYSPMMRFLAGLHAPAPKALRMAAEFVLNTELQWQFESERMDLNRVRTLLEECARDEVSLQADVLGYALKTYLDRLSLEFEESPGEAALLEHLVGAAALVHAVPFEINLWKTQNIFYRISNAEYPDRRAKATNGDASAASWIKLFEALGEQLGFRSQSNPTSNAAWSNLPR
jgi:alpha-amylase/alpha-mannosidase (GH57 family)